MMTNVMQLWRSRMIQVSLTVRLATGEDWCRPTASKLLQALWKVNRCMMILPSLCDVGSCASSLIYSVRCFLARSLLSRQVLENVNDKSSRRMMMREGCDSLHEAERR